MNRGDRALPGVVTSIMSAPGSDGVSVSAGIVKNAVGGRVGRKTKSRRRKLSYRETDRVLKPGLGGHDWKALRKD